MNVDDKLNELNIFIPIAPDPVGAYVAFKKVTICFLFQVNFPYLAMAK